AAGHGRPRQLLGQYVRPSPQRTASSLSAPRLAGRSGIRDAGTPAAAALVKTLWTQVAALARVPPLEWTRYRVRRPCVDHGTYTGWDDSQPDPRSCRSAHKPLP